MRFAICRVALGQYEHKIGTKQKHVFPRSTIKKHQTQQDHTHAPSAYPYNELQQSPKLDGPAASFQIHPFPSLLALGILLLEIELGRRIESQRAADHSNNTGVFNVELDLPEANDMLDECVDNTLKGFDEAVEACLNEATFIEESYRDAAFDDSNFREKIHLRIVMPQERELRSASGFTVEELNNLPYNSR